MCNLAGYSGTKNAAPILLEMLRRQEGFDGGFYTGIATIHEGKIHYAKVLGDTKTLIETTDALSLPGTIGIAHSRPGLVDCGKEWAHPFIGFKNDEAKLALIANGSIGYFSSNREKHNEIADALNNSGYNLTSKVNIDGNAYCKLSSGETIHISDVLCNLVLRNIDLGESAENAMADAFCELPLEVVSLMLSLTEPDKIFFSRINQPMFVGFSDDGAYLATAPFAFDNEIDDPKLLPALSSGYIQSNGYTVHPFKTPPASVAKTDATAYHKAYKLISDILKKEKKSYYNPVLGLDLPDLIKPVFEKADCFPASALSYSVLYALDKEGKLNIEKGTLTCPKSGNIAPHFTLSLK